jgi:hypothetical protein
MSLPFYLVEEGTEMRAFFIDETGQIFVWRGPGTQPESFGKRLEGFAGRDEPQGLLWQNKRLFGAGADGGNGIVGGGDCGSMGLGTTGSVAAFPAGSAS